MIAKTRPPARFKDEWLLRLLTSAGRLAGDAAESLEAGGSPYASTALLRSGLVSKASLFQAVSGKYGIACAESPPTPEKMALALLPERFCRERGVCPLRVEGDLIEILTADPIDHALLDAVLLVSGRRAAPVFGLPERIEELILAHYGSDRRLADLVGRLPLEAPVRVLSGESELGSACPAPAASAVERLADVIIAQAVRLKASDIHVEHEDKFTVVRYRIDGGLRQVMRVPKEVGDGSLVSRIKVMANLDIANRRRPQDGRAKLLVGSEEIGLRVSTIPTSFGEKAVLRILDNSQAEVSLDALGFRPEMRERLGRLLKANQGMILLTGPTGSGKTTTLYSMLHALKSEDINIVTVEDPIEYRLSGINQTQIDEKAGMGFSVALRSVLRQDPDVVLIGEIRDRETADIAFQAALTGHLVFSTLHTNDAAASVERLIDMGVERFKLAPALVGVVSQRLVRRLCPGCRAEAPVGPAVATMLREAGLPARRFKGAGCARCDFTGLSGRLALSEVLDLTAQGSRDALARADRGEGWRREARRAGWLTSMAEDALYHLAHGDIPLEEASLYLELPPERQGRPAEPRTAPRVLVVDDNEDNRITVRHTLRSEGYEMVEAAGGAEAVEEACRRTPDLVLLDLMMPDVDGCAVVRRLRARPETADVPIIVITALGEAESQARVLELGADDYMSKPFDPKVLRARVRALFRRRLA